MAKVLRREGNRDLAQLTKDEWDNLAEDVQGCIRIQDAWYYFHPSERYPTCNHHQAGGKYCPFQYFQGEESAAVCCRADYAVEVIKSNG